jgi:hypothetical protein
LSLQLLPFGKSDDDLGELTFEVGLFSVLSVWHGRSARGQWTVREEPVRQEFFVILFRFVLIRFVLGFRCSRFADGLSFSSGRSVARADGLPDLQDGPFFSGRFWWFCSL